LESRKGGVKNSFRVICELEKGEIQSVVLAAIMAREGGKEVEIRGE